MKKTVEQYLAEKGFAATESKSSLNEWKSEIHNDLASLRNDHVSNENIGEKLDIESLTNPSVQDRPGEGID